MSYRDVVRRALSVSPVGVPHAGGSTGSVGGASSTSCARLPVGADVVAFATQAGVQLTKLEGYLSREDFTRVMECSPEEFASLPAWKRDSLKKKLRLHVPVAAA